MGVPWQVTWSPCETERCLALLCSAIPGIPVAVFGARELKDSLLSSAKHSLEAMEVGQRHAQLQA